MGYYDGYNADLLRFIPPDTKTVLEIGCGEGALCAAYRRVNPSVLWFGIDSNREALDNTPDEMQTWYADLNQSFGARDFMSESLEQEIDCVICGDVLEHLINPMETLRACTEHVKPGAQVLACIPNVQHWTVIRDLLDGTWDYADSGLLDRTHLRFFTLKSIREMFDAAGLQVFEIVGRDLFNEGADAWARDTFAGMDFADREMRAYQYIVRAVKLSGECYAVGTLHNGGTDVPVDMPKKLYIHAVTAEDCCARPRVLEPFAMLGTMPGVKCTAWPSHLPEISRPEIWIQQRERDFDMERQQILLTLASILIAEVDDLPEAIGMDPMALKAVHAIQCSTEALAEVCRKYNPNVMVFENQIADLPPFDRVKKLPHDDTVRIFCGWQNRTEDWKPIMPALNRILADHSGILVCVVHDVEFYNALEVGPCDSHKEFHEFCEYAEYRRLLGRCDIALLPLEDTPFNRCKSDIKFVECAAEGVAVLGSLFYGHPFDEPQMGEFYGEPGSFELSLRAMIEHPEFRSQYARSAYNYIRRERLLSQHYRKRYEWYQSLLSSKPAFDQQLLERVPELSAHLAPA